MALDLDFKINLILAPYEITTISPTTTAKSPVYSKYVCGVKGTSRSNRQLFYSQDSYYSEIEEHTDRGGRSLGKKTKEVKQKKTIIKAKENLVLGTELVAKKLDYPKKINRSIRSLNNSTSMINGFRESRVVGGEDGENGEWCWQVALINSLNQYLCGAALIGTQWVLTGKFLFNNSSRVNWEQC